MTKEELVDFCINAVGIPYNTSSNIKQHSIENGFNCFTWSAYLYSMYGLPNYKYPKNIKQLRKLHYKFTKEKTPQFLDAVVFYHIELGEKHVGIMLDEHNMTHCSSLTNGVSLADIRYRPWVSSLKGIYRHS